MANFIHPWSGLGSPAIGRDRFVGLFSIRICEDSSQIAARSVGKLGEKGWVEVRKM